MDAITPKRTDGFLPIEHYAAIGSGRELALVGIDGSIDWLCVPTLDSPSVFAALLDPARGGRFTLAPAIPYESERRYVEHTNVLETTFVTAEGRVRVTEAVSRPAGESPPGAELVRSAEGLTGRVPLAWRVAPRFDYGATGPEIDRRGDAWILSSPKGMRLALQAWDAGDPRPGADGVGADTVVAEGSQMLLCLSAVDSEPLLLSRRESVERRLAATVEYWRRWAGRIRFDGHWSDAVERSLLAIALLADDRTGAIAAAATTSLPEVVGGKRNFDYRYAWVRDLSFTLDALLEAGLDDLVHKSFTWLLQSTVHTHPRVDPVYKLGGSVLRGQGTIPLAGYRGTAPVHVGNQAGTQLQLGGFGDLVETAWLYTRHGGVFDPDTAERIADNVDLLERIWRCPDAGLWELSDYAQYTSSKMSCWAAFDRALKLADSGQMPPRHHARWHSARGGAIENYVETQLWSETKRSYLQKAGSDDLDAACLLAARRGYGDRHPDRIDATIDAIRNELSAGPPLLYRYTGMSEQENAFLACSFWLVEALSKVHRFDEAAETMEALLALSSGVGLYSEEMDPVTKAMWGNMPQALTHLALINAAVLFDQSLDEARAPKQGDVTQAIAKPTAAAGQPSEERT